MSDLRKWLKIMESVPAEFTGQPTPERLIKKDATVMVDPRVGGGTGRYMHSTPNGAMIDIKGIARELSEDDFSLPQRDYEDPYQKGNDWFHVSTEPDTVGRMNDKPEFRPGDMVKIADVYGSVIGPGFGVFVAYGTTGQDCTISFDNKNIVVPIENVASVLEQDAKDNFDQMDNDGNLSPMSLGSDNVKIEQPQNSGMQSREPAMDQRDEFSKWMGAVEEALADEGKELAEDMPPQGNNCGCGSWDCPTCFPSQDEMPGMNGAIDGLGGVPPESTVVFGGIDMNPAMPVPSDMPQQACQVCSGDHQGHDHGMDSEIDVATNDIDVDMMGLEEIDGNSALDDEELDDGFVDEEENTFVEKPKSGKGVKLGDIVQKTEFKKSGGQNSPMTYGDENLGEGPDDVDFDGPEELEMGSPLSQRDYSDEMDQLDPDEALDMVAMIKYMQDMGLSKAPQAYNETQLAQMSPAALKKFHAEVMGDVAEATRPTKTRTQDFNLDDMDDVLNPRQAHLPANIDEPAGFDQEDDRPAGMNLPAASSASTTNRTRNMTATDTMRDLMSRMDRSVGVAEPDRPPVTDVVVRTANDVPAVVSSAMQAAGMQSPEWHLISNLPGMNDRAIRAVGRGVFGLMTTTPVEEIKTIANVGGQGPNTDAEMRAVAGWLRDNAEDLGPTQVDHSRVMPGYAPDARDYRINGVKFHVVKDQSGVYVYAWPDSTSKQLSGPGANAQIGNGGNMPRLRESAEFKDVFKVTLFEQIKWDEELKEAFAEIEEELIDESSLSRLLGKQKGGQNLVKWMHRRQGLSNDADLTPASFNERIFWKQFKANPDNFVVVSATGGVAGIKPDKKFIDARTKEFAKKGKTYNPGGDSTVPYQIIAFTDDGQQVDPELLRAPKDAGEEDYRDPRDPTVMRARMGKHSGKDIQNPYNVFNLLAEQIGALKTVWISGFENEKDAPTGRGSVERDKMSKRAELKKGPEVDEMSAVKQIFKRVRPVLKTLGAQALSQINNRAKRYIDGGNFEGAQKIAANGNKLKQFLATIDTSGDVNIDTAYGSQTRSFSEQIIKAIADASGGPRGSQEFKDFLQAATQGNSVALKPVLDALRDNLVSLA